MVKSKIKAKQLCAFGLHFRYTIKRVEKYGEARPNSVCMTCCSIGYEYIDNYNNRPPKCIIYASLYKVSEHWCEIVGYSKGIEKSCIYVIAKYVNYNNNHPANFLQYAL